MTYGVKETFVTLQGEGARAGTKAVFLRLTGCNMWNGKPADRNKGKGACAQWCDTDFYKGEKLSANEIRARLELLWPDTHAQGRLEERWVVITGGEPALQYDVKLRAALGPTWNVAMETNGTVQLEAAVDWLCVSPKLLKNGEVPKLAVRKADELKVVLPGVFPWEDNEQGWTDAKLHALEEIGDWRNLYVQPQDTIDQSTTGKTHLHGDVVYLPQLGSRGFDEHLERAIRFVLDNPQWRLSAQVHKYIKLP